MNLIFIFRYLNLRLTPYFLLDFRLSYFLGSFPCFLGFILLARAIICRLLGLSEPFPILFFRLSTVSSFWPLLGLYQTLWSLLSF